MNRLDTKIQRRLRVKKGIRKKVFGTAERPRLTIFRSNTSIYAQIIDDVARKTLVSCSSRIKLISEQKITKTQRSAEVGKLVANKAIQAGISTVVFDRNGYKYHGRVKAVAEGAREGGLQF